MADSPKIKLLADDVINQIAAGEVVERPLSIVKELVENALDAGCMTLEVEIMSGGLDQIIVSDDGSGIAKDELVLALRRHCTSKLNAANDIEGLVTLGFRGEALASVAAVSELELISRVADAPHAWRVASEFGRETAIEPAASYLPGTRVSVTKLFENTPARRKFQKQARTEQIAILQFLKHLAFCHPELNLRLHADGKPLLRVSAQTPNGASERRLQTLFGKEFAAGALALDCEGQGIAVHGWIGPGDYHRPRADIQFFSVNRRVIRDKALLHAVRLAYDGKIPDGRYPAFALALRMPPQGVDINVHPAKTQVRFAEPRQIHDQLYSFIVSRLTADSPLFPDDHGSTIDCSDQAGVAQNLTKASQTRAPAFSLRESTGGVRYRPRTNPLFTDSQNNGRELVGLIARQFAVLGTGDSIAFIDLHRFLANLFQLRLAADQRARPLIVPEPIPKKCLDYFTKQRESLRALGIVIESIGPDSSVLREVPLVLPPLDYPSLMSDLALNNDVVSVSAIALSAATHVNVPITLQAQQKWFQQFVEQASKEAFDWREFEITKSTEQWREFLRR